MRSTSPRGPDRSLIPSRALAVARLAFAALAVAAIGYQLVDLASRGTLNPANFFSYFTIQSNLIAIAALTLAAVGSFANPPRRWDMLRGGAVVYMTVTGVVYALLLSGADVDTALNWVNTVVHQVMPIVVVVDWLLDPPANHIALRRSLVWVVYPLAWIAYTMIRGLIVGWYPYPFLDPAPNGYAPVIVTTGVIVAAGVALCVMVAAVGNALRSRRAPEAPDGPLEGSPAA
jgi:cell division protein FtsW (lipid II flippase)